MNMDESLRDDLPKNRASEGGEGMAIDGAAEAEEARVSRIVRRVVERLEDKGYTNSLRDQFAMAALTAAYDSDGPLSFTEEAHRAYEIADAMLWAREQRREG